MYSPPLPLPYIVFLRTLTRETLPHWQSRYKYLRERSQFNEVRKKKEGGAKNPLSVVSDARDSRTASRRPNLTRCLRKTNGRAAVPDHSRFSPGRLTKIPPIEDERPPRCEIRSIYVRATQHCSPRSKVIREYFLNFHRRPTMLNHWRLRGVQEKVETVEEL